MQTNQIWTIKWPESFSEKQHKIAILLQTEHSSSQVLISNQKPKEFYRFITVNRPELCLHSHINLKFIGDITEKKIRSKTQDQICFLVDEFSIISEFIHLELCASQNPTNLKDFGNYLKDILFFFQDRFSNRFKGINLFIDAPNFDLNHFLNLFRYEKFHHFFGLTFFPYYHEKQGFDTLKTAFTWKPFTRAVILQDIDFDGKTEVYPGNGIVLNKSACQIALENQNLISFIFQPQKIPFLTSTHIEQYILNAEYFAKTIS